MKILANYPKLIGISLLLIAAVFLMSQKRETRIVQPVVASAEAISDLEKPEAIKPETDAPVVAEEKPVIVHPAAPVAKPKPKPAPRPAPAPQPAPAPAPQPAPAPAPVSCDEGSFNTQFLCLINEYRKSKGLNQLSYEGALNAVALDHSEWMSENGTMSHIGENGSKFYERCKAGGTSCDAENVAKGYTTPLKLFNAWKASPGHNANMLGSHTRMGLALSGIYATQLFR